MRLTASKLSIARKCPGAFALPWHEHATPDTEAGIEHHAEKEASINAGKLPDAIAERWPDLKWYAEVAFAYDVVTGRGRVLGYGLGRDYSMANANEVCGTADAVGVGDSGLVVLDWKSHAEVERASVNAQLHVAALAVADHYEREEATVAIHYESRPMDVADLDTFDLETFAAELHVLVALVRHAEAGHATRWQEGDHCRWCPAFHACPKKQALKTEVESRLVYVEQGGQAVPFLERDEDAAAAYEFAERVRMLLKRVDAAIYARAKERPIPLSNGKMFGLVPKKGRDQLDADKLYAIVRDKFGQGIADAAVIRTATKKRLGEALDFAGVKSKAAAERELLAELREQGGIANEPKMVMDEYEPQPQLKAVES